ncbi:MAG: hypothetical protein II319_04275, partial [Clostridia bacterium]|nr:hypothetical protein [Clostridia bacterium]
NASEIEREFGVCRKSCERAVRAYKEGRKINMNRNSKEKFRKMINKAAPGGREPKVYVASELDQLRAELESLRRELESMKRGVA